MVVAVVAAAVVAVAVVAVAVVAAEAVVAAAAVAVAAVAAAVVVAEEDPVEEDISVEEDILDAGDKDNFVGAGHMGNVVLLVGHKVASVHPADPAENKNKQYIIFTGIPRQLMYLYNNR